MLVPCILVSDYLIDALHGVESNLGRPRAPLSRASRRMGARGGLREGCNDGWRRWLPVVKLPPRLRPIDDLIHRLVDLHTSGVFRAIGSTLDCLASVVIGVAGIETNILRGDWATLIDRALPALKEDGRPGRKLQLELRDEIARLLTLGQREWDRWSSDFRNMLVHRGPRMTLSTLRPDNNEVDAEGHRIIRTHTIHQLTRDPELSEMEAFVVGAKLSLQCSPKMHTSACAA